MAEKALKSVRRKAAVIGGMRIANSSSEEVTHRAQRRGGHCWWIVCIAAVLVSGIFFSWLFWEDLNGKRESLSTTVSDVGLVIGGVIAMLLAVWRSTIAQQQVDAAQRQAATAHQGLLNERYQKGAEMLGSEIPSVRLAGVYALASLARDHPEQYNIQIIELLCAFIRNPPEIKEGQGKGDSQDDLPPLREDVQAAITAVGGRSKRGLSYEKAGGFRLDLSGAWLKWAKLRNAQLSGAKLPRANLNYANLKCADLSGADLGGAYLPDAWLKDTDLSGAYLGPDFLPDPSGEPGDLDYEYAYLTQRQLDEAKADPNNPPKLGGADDYETGKPLIWRGGSL